MRHNMPGLLRGPPIGAMTQDLRIGPLDALIAAHALALEAVLVTRNVREFRRVGGLRVENRLAP